MMNRAITKAYGDKDDGDGVSKLQIKEKEKYGMWSWMMDNLGISRETK